jgi:hypothetical protein
MGMSLMRVFAILLLLIIGKSSSGQPFSYPVFKDPGKTVHDFIPANWLLKYSVGGDLNGDGIPDLALIAEYKNAITEIRPDSSRHKARPRVLLIMFKDSNSGFYHPVLQNNTYISRTGENGTDEESFKKLSISKKILSVEYEYPVGNSIYKFRYQNGDFYLIGANSFGSHNSEFTEMDINFLTRKAKVTTGDPVSKNKIEWHNVLISQPVKLKDLKMLYKLQVLPGIYF